MTRQILVGFLLLVALGPAPAAAQQLVPATEPQLINCNNKPCFRMTLNALDAEGRPVPLDVSSGGDRGFEITEGSNRYKPFYVSALDEPASSARGMYWMLLL